MVVVNKQILCTREFKMFHESNYDTPEFYMAPNGMNQFISPDALPSNFCYLLENIIPSPLGVGQVRFGNQLNYTLPTPQASNPEFDIIRSFPFKTSNGVDQSILYVNYYSQDLNTNTRASTGPYQISFNTTTPNNYIKDTKVKIVYTFNGENNNLYSDIEDLSVIGNNVVLTLADNVLPDTNSGALVITEIWCQFGSIFSYNFDGIEPVPRIAGLSAACVPRCAYSQQVMLICNGVNDVMVWDGNVLTEMHEFVVEIKANTFTRINNTNFSFNSLLGFVQAKYFIGNSIKLNVDGISSNLTILNIVPAGNLITITTNEQLPAFVEPANQVSIFYKDKPPKFSYIYVLNDRIWAIGPGAVGLGYRDIDERLRIYHSYLVNPIDGFGLFNQNTKTVPSIDMSDKHNIQDNFEAICQVNGLMAFIGRKGTQVWAGNNPNINGNFSWVSTLSIGIFHGDLLIELANDVYFISDSGLNSFSTLNIAKQFSASPTDAVNTIIKKFLSQASESNYKYRKCTSFKYEKGTIAGFKISDNKVLASLFSANLYSWFYLSGDFRLANCFMDLGKQFYLFIGNKIFKYADGNDGQKKIYGDNDGKSLIPIAWTPKLIKFSNKKGYANKRYEVVLDYPSSFTLNNSNVIEISISGDTPKSFYLTDTCKFEEKGDLLGQEPLGELKEDSENYLGFRLRKEYEIVNKRLKFKASSFWLSITGYVMNGPVTFRKIKLYGVGERNG